MHKTLTFLSSLVRFPSKSLLDAIHKSLCLTFLFPTAVELNTDINITTLPYLN